MTWRRGQEKENENALKIQNKMKENIPSVSEPRAATDRPMELATPDLRNQKMNIK